MLAALFMVAFALVMVGITKAIWEFVSGWRRQDWVALSSGPSQCAKAFVIMGAVLGLIGNAILAVRPH
jgi:hypothetical protein